MSDFASREWLDEFWAALRASDAVRQAGATWAHGPMLFVIEAEADKGFPGAVAVRIDVHEGEVRDVRVAERLIGPWRLTAPYTRWKAVFSDGADLVDAITGSRVSFIGDLPTFTKHRALWNAVTASTRTLTTTYPDDVPAETEAAAPAGAR
jgi:hypothetical protein